MQLTMIMTGPPKIKLNNLYYNEATQLESHISFTNSEFSFKKITLAH